MAVPGSVVGVGKLITPGGQQGPAGTSGPTSPSSDAGNLLTTGSDSLLYLPPSAIQPTIWSVRLRSFNAISAFEVDQRNVGTALTNPANAVFVQDRWVVNRAGLTGTVNTALQDVSTAPVVVPGTNFGITSKYQRFTVGTAQASLASGDYWSILQNVEGPLWRELSSDVHSLSLLVRSSVAGLKFSVSLRDNTNAHSLVSQCTISSSGIWVLVTIPNLPVWSGSFSAAPGQVGYTLAIVLAAGATFTAAASSSWQTANILGVTGNSNFLATAGSTFDIAFCQHEPGSLATTLQDKSFIQSLDEALRHFQKSYPYPTALGTVTNVGSPTYIAANASYSWPYMPIKFPKIMAKTPTMTGYSPTTGAINNIRDISNNTDRATNGAVNPGDSGFSGFNTSTNVTANTSLGFHYTADTGW